MYPAILRDELFPTKLGPKFYDLPPRELPDMCRGMGCIARVLVRTDRAEYPVRRDADTVYPLGTFNATLAGPDLLALAAHGEILKVYECATYRIGRPFAGAMDALLDARARFDESGDRDWCALCKLVANSLGGKLAQRKGGWKRAPEMDEPGRWGQYHIDSSRAERLIRYRYLAGAAWRWEEEKIPRGPHTAAFAYLTAYGRQQMARLRALCPAKSVVSQDTDGLWVLRPALDALEEAGHLTVDGPGALRLTRTVETARFFGPRHYVAGGKWVLSGFHAPTVNERDLTARYSHRSPLSCTREREAPREVISVSRHAPIPTDLQRGTVGADGWVIAPTVLRSWGAARLDSDRT